jgi:hypothetical protein
VLSATRRGFFACGFDSQTIVRYDTATDKKWPRGRWKLPEARTKGKVPQWPPQGYRQLAIPSTQQPLTVIRLITVRGCNDGWITLGQLVVDPETGEETEEYALYLCRQCAEQARA